MIKKCISMLLVLALLLPAFAAAEATEAAAPAYVPGSVISGLFTEAFNAGSMVCADVDLTIELNNEALGLEGEEAEMADAVTEILNTAIISGAAAKTADTLVLSVVADYTKEGAEGAFVGVRAGVSKEGLYLESSLLPEERVSAKWETLLKLLGADDATAAQILALRDVNPEQLAAQITQMAQQYLPLVAQFASPYGNIISEFIAGLPASAEADVAAEGYFPAAKTEVTYTVTVKALGGLLAKLADQLENDPVVSAVLNAVLTNPEVMGDNAMTCSALCENIRAVAAQMTDESSPLFLFFGYDENDTLLYGAAAVVDGNGTTYALNVVDATLDPAQGSGYTVELFMTDTAENYSGVYASWLYSGNPADKHAFDLSALFEVSAANTTLMSMEYAVSSEPTVTEENLPGYNGYQSMSMSMIVPETAENINAVSYAEMQEYLTADGGETQLVYSSSDMYIGETTTQSTTETYFAAIPSEEGPIGRYVEAITQPASGINNAMIDCSLYTVPFDDTEIPAIIALETATQEDLDALYTRLLANAQPMMDALFAQLPAPILEMIAGDLAAEAPAEAEIEAAPAAAM